MKLIKVILSSISQVVLINNPYTGLFILIGLFAVNWKVGISAMIASVMTWILAPYMNYTKEEIESGLAGFNPVLTAIALTLFLDSNWSGILITFVATILTLPIGAAVREVLKPHKIAFLTSPYVIMTWITLLIPNQLKTLHTQIDIIPEHIEKVSFNNDHTSVHFFQSVLDGFGQIFLMPSIIGGLLILIGIFIGSKKAGIVSIIANIIGFLIIILLGGDYSSINEGIFGYNVVLSAIALGVTFETAIHSYLAMILGIVLTAFIHLGLSTLLAPLGLPTLTWPFIFATWIMLFAGIKNQTV